MKAKELAELLMQNPDMEVLVDCCINPITYDNPYPEYERCNINNVSVERVWNGVVLIIECS